MNAVQQRRSWRPWALTLALTTILAGSGIAAWRYAPRLLAAYWARQLETAGDESVAPLLESIAATGTAGLPALVDGLGSQRELVTNEAAAALWREMERWQALPPEDSAERLSLLAMLLAEHIEDSSDQGRAVAADLAGRILAWPNRPAFAGQSEMLAACRKVIGDVSNEPQSMQDALISIADVPAAGAPPVEEPPRVNPLRTRETDSVADSVEPPEPQAIEAKPLPRMANQATPPTPSVALPAPQPRSPATPSAPVDANANGVANQPYRLGESDVADTPKPLSSAESAGNGRGLIAAISRRLADPDPAVRKELAEALPSLSGVDAVPWLLQLARDKDPEVRLTAITLLATTGDPALLARLRAQALEDSDPRIRTQAERLSGVSSMRQR